MRSQRMNTGQYDCETLKARLLDPRFYHRTNSLIDTTTFVHANETLYLKLLRDLQQAKKGGEKSRGPSWQFAPPKPKSQQMQLNVIAAENEQLRMKLMRLRQLQSIKEVQEQPLLKQKQEIIMNKSKELLRVKAESVGLQKAVEDEDMLEMYEQVCRECENMRKVNNGLSEELKEIIKQENALSGKNENPDIFFMNLKL